MAGLLLVFVLLFFALAVVAWLGTLFFQAYIYSEPTPQLVWRGPLAGLVLTLFYGFWCMLDYKNPGAYNSITQFTATEEEGPFDTIWAVKNGKEYAYKAKKNAKGQVEYRDENNKQWSRGDSEGITEAVIIQDREGQKVRFNAELSPDKKFKKNEATRYVEADGQHRVMTDEYMGRITIVRTGRIVANLFLNVLHGVVWWLCLWLILRFQMWHALGLAFVFWLAATFFVPTLFSKTEDVAKQRAAQAKASAQATPNRRFVLVYQPPEGAAEYSPG